MYISVELIKNIFIAGTMKCLSDKYLKTVKFLCQSKIIPIFFTNCKHYKLTTFILGLLMVLINIDI